MNSIFLGHESEAMNYIIYNDCKVLVSFDEDGHLETNSDGVLDFILIVDSPIKCSSIVNSKVMMFSELMLLMEDQGLSKFMYYGEKAYIWDLEQYKNYVRKIINDKPSDPFYKKELDEDPRRYGLNYDKLLKILPIYDYLIKFTQLEDIGGNRFKLSTNKGGYKQIYYIDRLTNEVIEELDINGSKVLEHLDNFYVVILMEKFNTKYAHFDEFIYKEFGIDPFEYHERDDYSIEDDLEYLY